MAKNKVNEATQNLVNSFSDANQAIANSAVGAQERNVQYAQNIVENGTEVLKSHAESTRALMQELANQPQNQQRVFQAITESTLAAQERNVRFAQNVIGNGIEVLKSHAESTRDLMQNLLEQSQKQQAAFLTLTQESLNAYVYTPLSYYQQALDTSKSIAWEGMETAQKITRQGVDTAQKATRQGMDTAQETAHKASR